MPLSVVRWIEFLEEVKSVETRQISPTAVYVTVTIFALSGVVNSILYLLTRRRFFRPDKRGEPRAPAIKMVPPTKEN